MEEEDGRAFVEVGAPVFPLLHGEGLDVFGGGGEVAGDGEERARVEGLKHFFQEFLVAVGGFDEYLGAIFLCGLPFVVAEGFGAFGGFDGEVAVEGEGLPVQPGGDERQQDGGGANEGHDGVAVAVSQSHEFRTGVGNAGTAGFGDDADVALREVGEACLDVFLPGMFVEFEESPFFQPDAGVGFFQETTGVFGVFAGEYPDVSNQGDDFCGNDALDGGFSQQVRNQIYFSHAAKVMRRREFFVIFVENVSRSKGFVVIFVP